MSRLHRSLPPPMNLGRRKTFGSLSIGKGTRRQSDASASMCFFCSTVLRFVSGANDSPSPLRARKARKCGKIDDRLLSQCERYLLLSDHGDALSAKVWARALGSENRAGTERIIHLNRKSRTGLNSLIGAHSALSPFRLCRAVCGIQNPRGEYAGHDPTGLSCVQPPGTSRPGTEVFDGHRIAGTDSPAPSF